MHNKILYRLLICACVMTFQLHSNVIADESICLSCHQYPGLVQQNDKAGLKTSQKDGLKILHIDKARYRASAHGNLDCNACHLEVDKIPHVGKNRTNCQSAECHQSKKDRQLIADTPRKGFHRQEQSVITVLEDRTSCKVCHKIYPHTKQPVVSVFLNMHTGYMVCEVCHLDRGKFTVARYDWIQTKDVEFHGEPFGTFFVPINKLSKTPKSTLSRIAPYVLQNGKQQALVNTWDTDGAIKVCSSRTRIGEDEMVEEINHYHRDVVKMERTTACDECHSARSMIDFHALGYSKDRIDSLKNQNIRNIIKKYDTFYLPAM